MNGTSVGRGLAAGVAVTALGLLLLPAADAGGLPPVEGPDAPPGITITGLGFARLTPPRHAGVRVMERAVEAAHPVAVDRAVRDARRRSVAIARAAGVQVGQVEQVDLPELSQFGGRELCRGRDGPGRCRVPTLTAAAATVTFAIVGGATGEEGSRGVHAHGTASAVVSPSDPRRNQPIRRALLVARRTVTPEAAAVARRNARTATHSAGLSLGPIVSIAEATPFYYGPSFYDAALGTFGPGRYCGLVNRPVVRPDPETGVPRVVRRVRQRRCIVQRTYSLQLDIAYEARYP